MKREELTKAIMEKLPENPTKEQIEELVKAVTSDAAPAENKPVDEDTANGESTPTIQDAVNPLETKTEEVTETVAEVTEPVAEETTTTTEEVKTAEEAAVEVKQAEIPEGISPEAQGGQTQEIKFADDLFKPISLGSTLEQAQSGNVMANVKKPQMDYEQAYKNSIKNEKVTVKKK